MMTSQTAVDLLIDKGKFDPYVALAVAEAIDTVMTESQILTVPLFDSRLADLKADSRVSLGGLEKKVDTTKVDLERKLDVTRADLEKKIEVTKADLEGKLDVTRADLEKKIEVTKADLEGKLDATKADLEKKIEVTKADLERKIDVTKADLEKKIEVTSERTKAELVRWVFLVMLGNVALSAGATAALNALQR